ncbi:MAG TPA: hypothetical protein VGD53_34260 [Actinoallomurus sp.]
MVLALGTVTVVALLVIGIMTLAGGSDGHTSPGKPASPPPVEAAVPPAPTWGTYVPPRRLKRTPAPTRTRTASVPPPRPRPTHASPRPSTATTCPATLKKWPWVWEACKRKQNG